MSKSMKFKWYRNRNYPLEVWDLIIPGFSYPLARIWEDTMGYTVTVSMNKVGIGRNLPYIFHSFDAAKKGAERSMGLRKPIRDIWRPFGL